MTAPATDGRRRKVDSVLPARPVSVIDDLEPRDYVPISDLDSEGIVLSCALNDFPEGCLPKLLASLRAEHFYATANQRVWEAVEALALDSKPVDPSSVARVMRARGTLQLAGGVPYLADVLACCQPSVVNWQTHADAVRELWRQRTLCEEMRRIEIRLRHGEMDHEGAKLALREHFMETKC